MEKIFNWICLAAGVIGGFFAQALGGWDVLLKVLLGLVILDYGTGILKAIYLKSLSSEIGYKGIIKKIFIFIFVAAACLIGRLTNNLIPLREAVIIFFAANEGLSLVENISEVIPVPENLKDILLQLRDKTSITKEDKEK